MSFRLCLDPRLLVVLLGSGFLLAPPANGDATTETFTSQLSSSPAVCWTIGEWATQHTDFVLGGSVALASPTPGNSYTVSAHTRFDSVTTVRFDYAIVNYAGIQYSNPGYLEFAVNGQQRFVATEVTAGTTSPPISVSPGLANLTWTYTIPGGAHPARYTVAAIDNVVFGDVSAPCPEDFNGDCQLSVQDVFAYLSAWFAGDPRCNFDGVNDLQVADLFAFLNAWFNGCP